ncbi:Plasma membrane proteolipid 3-like protein 3 [Seiridium cupressi]
MFKRLVVLFFNLLFPPLAVFLLCGFGADFAMNCFLFLLAVIPSHIHGMYISFIYFHRKNREYYKNRHRQHNHTGPAVIAEVLEEWITETNNFSYDIPAGSSIISWLNGIGDFSGVTTGPTTATTTMTTTTTSPPTTPPTPTYKTIPEP